MKRTNTTYSNHPNHACRVAHQRAKQEFPTYDTSLIRPKKNKKPLAIFLVVLAIILIIVAGSIYYFSQYSTGTLASGKTVEVTIEPGSSTSQIANKVSEAGVIENTNVFLKIVNDMQVETQLKPGTYIFEGGKSAKEYIEILCSGPDANSSKILVTEGMKLSDIAKNVAKVSDNAISESDFISATSDASKYANKYSFLTDAGTNSLEGFLFPKTYTYNKSDSVSDIVEKMLNQFDKEFKAVDLTVAKSKNLNVYDVINLASIVEKESTQEVRGKVASVFYNRLKEGMYLNSDATTAYEVGHDPTPEEVHSDSPYSTYTNFGLPPTPICSPGIESIKAVANPENTDYLYFYFKTDSSGKLHYKFSATYEEHQQAIVDMRGL